MAIESANVENGHINLVKRFFFLLSQQKKKKKLEKNLLKK
jgi:hypothetical protein